MPGEGPTEPAAAPADRGRPPVGLWLLTSLTPGGWVGGPVGAALCSCTTVVGSVVPTGTGQAATLSSIGHRFP